MSVVRLIVTQISSVVDDDGNRGKEIILEEFKNRQGIGGPQEIGFLKEMMDQVLRNFGQGYSIRSQPKIVLRLNDEEYESLGIKFEVNDIYEVNFSDGKLHFNKQTV
jgi:hypothetical protein